ncbi:hypothetical protein [Marinobacter sp.]|uniref:hypothetical protein n=1 Tax=Marinobacter sp. TaxID=50741 RepID=UPI00384B5B87
MSSELIYETMRERYQSQRDRREQIRSSVATPVTALAFSVYTLAWVSGRIDVSQWENAPTLAAMVLMSISVLCLLAGAIFIVRMERNIIYIDPPDLEELVAAESRLRQLREKDHEYVQDQMRGMMAGAYDIIYRRYFASNEQASRDRTRGLHLIVFGLSLTMIALVVLPFQGGGV